MINILIYYPDIRKNQALDPRSSDGCVTAILSRGYPVTRIYPPRIAGWP